MGLRVGIVGLSIYYSRAYAEALMRIERADFVAACSLGQSSDYANRCIGLTKDKYASPFNVTIYDELDEMVLSEKLNSVFICGETAMNGTLAAQAATHGVDVFICKPMAQSIEDARRADDAATSAGIKLSAGTGARGDVAIREARSRIDAGEIGDIVSIRSWIQHARMNVETMRDHPWNTPKSGMSLEYGIAFYSADLINWFADYREIDRVFCTYGNRNTPGSAEPDTGKGIVIFKDGLTASFDSIYSTTFPAPLWEIEIVGQKGMIRTQQNAFEGYVLGEDGPEPFAGRYQQPSRNASDAITTELGLWVDACLDGHPPHMPAEQAVRAVELCVAFDRSAKTGKPVTFRVVTMPPTYPHS